MVEKPYWTLAEFAQEIGVTLNTVYHYASRGYIPVVELFGKKAVPKEAWRAWLEIKANQALKRVTDK